VGKPRVKNADEEGKPQPGKEQQMHDAAGFFGILPGGISSQPQSQKQRTQRKRQDTE
jgi:hypothetical protein